MAVAGALYNHTAAKIVFVRIFRGSRHLHDNTVLGWICWTALVVIMNGLAFVLATGVPVSSSYSFCMMFTSSRGNIDFCLPCRHCSFSFRFVVRTYLPFLRVRHQLKHTTQVYLRHCWCVLALRRLHAGKRITNTEKEMVHDECEHIDHSFRCFHLCRWSICFDQRYNRSIRLRDGGRSFQL